MVNAADIRTTTFGAQADGPLIGDFPLIVIPDFKWTPVRQQFLL